MFQSRQTRQVGINRIVQAEVATQTPDVSTPTHLQLVNQQPRQRHRIRSPAEPDPEPILPNLNIEKMNIKSIKLPKTTLQAKKTGLDLTLPAKPTDPMVYVVIGAVLVAVFAVLLPLFVVLNKLI